MDELDEVPLVCFCGLPMSRNPHPDAGKPTLVGVAAVGAVWECIPCMYRSRNSASFRWRDAQLEVDRLSSIILRTMCSCKWVAHEGKLHDPHCRALRVLNPQKGTDGNAVLRS